MGTGGRFEHRVTSQTRAVWRSGRGGMGEGLLSGKEGGHSAHVENVSNVQKSGLQHMFYIFSPACPHSWDVCLYVFCGQFFVPKAPLFVFPHTRVMPPKGLFHRHFDLTGSSSRRYSDKEIIMFAHQRALMTSHCKRLPSMLRLGPAESFFSVVNIDNGWETRGQTLTDN